MARKSERFEDSRGIDSIEGAIKNRFDNYDITEADIERNLRMDFQNEMWVDLRYKPDDMVYVWARESVRGQTDMTALMSRRRLGWTPVPRSRHPEFRYLFSDGQESGDDCIRVKDSILLERHIKYHDIATAKSEEANFEAMQGVLAMERLNANNPVPIGVKGNEMSFGYGRGRTFN